MSRSQTPSSGPEPPELEGAAVPLDPVPVPVLVLVLVLFPDDPTPPLVPVVFAVAPSDEPPPHALRRSRLTHRTVNRIIDAKATRLREKWQRFQGVF